MVSTGAVAPFLVDAASPAEEATRFEQLMRGAMVKQQSRAAMKIRGISHRGIVHLSLW
jgi:hypothetical protein